MPSGAGIAQWYSAGLWARWSGVSSPSRGWEFFSSPPRPNRLWSPSSLLSNGYQVALYLGVKWQGREADHSLPSSAEVKNAWGHTSTPQYAFMARWSVKAQGQLYPFIYKPPSGRKTKLQQQRILLVSNEEVSANDELESMEVQCCETLSRRCVTKIMEVLSRPVFGPRFQLGTSRIQSRSANYYTAWKLYMWEQKARSY
jgi:hypothetical protein